jgi:hypothetical protein
MFTKKTKKIKFDMNKKYPELREKAQFNLSFRQGDPLHSQWTSYEEECYLPYLVNIGDKLVASICNSHENKLDYVEDLITDQYKDIKIFREINKWGMYIMLIYKTNINSYTLYGLMNETLSWNEMGDLYGYK